MTKVNIKLVEISKRFRFEWIFKGLDLELNDQDSYALIGPNGSGKSTLLQIISGALSPSKGSLTYQIAEQVVSVEDIYRYLSLCTPYMNLIDVYSLEEMIDFHQQFKDFLPGLSAKDVLAIIDLKKARHKELRYFSSGMRQRVKTALAILSHTPILLLDEPTNNLDEAGIDWYQSLIKNYSTNRLVIVASNQKYEYDFCKKHIRLLDYK